MKWNPVALFKNELSSFPTRSRLFILCAMFCGFLISADYAVIRPVSNAVFLTTFGTAYFPYAWILTIPINLLLVGLYNKYLPRLGCFKMFLCIAASIVSFNLFCAVFLQQIPWLSFVFYIWKEIYILLMFQQLWSVIHSTISFSKAKYLYGILFGVGGCGAVLGSLLPSFFAVKMGSESLLFATAPIYGLLAILFFYALKMTEGGVDLQLGAEKQKTSLEAFWHGMKLVGQSRYLTFILCIVVFMQMSSSLIDYQFNSVLEKTVLDKDLRTQFTGRILGIMHILTIGLQFLGSFLLVQFLGIKRSHFLLPSLLAMTSVAFYFFPLFGVISLSYISIKSFDFSLFSVIKEMLYIPLKPDEKFRAKAVIDVFAHRSSKALVSVLILSLQACFTSLFPTLLSWSSILLFGLWMLIVVKLFKEQPLEAVKE